MARLYLYKVNQMYSLHTVDICHPPITETCLQVGNDGFIRGDNGTQYSHWQPDHLVTPLHPWWSISSIIVSTQITLSICFRHQTDSDVSRSRFTKAMMLVVMIREMVDILDNAKHQDTLKELWLYCDLFYKRLVYKAKILLRNSNKTLLTFGLILAAIWQFQFKDFVQFSKFNLRIFIKFLQISSSLLILFYTE